MHLLIPYASVLSEPFAAALREQALPNLGQLLTRLKAGPVDEGDEHALTPPHERAMAASWGWQGCDDGTWPFAAHCAARDGVTVSDLPWGLITPTHWQVQRNQVVLAHPEILQLSETASRAAFEAVRPLFETEGFRLAWGAPWRWYGTHPELAHFPCASLDRAIGRPVEMWGRMGIAASPAARLIQRLQSEVQLMLYTHPFNESREAHGELPLNSFWLSGCGRWQAAQTTDVVVNDSLRGPGIAQEAAAWAQAWCALDAGPVAELLARSKRNEPVSLTLCGERHGQRFDSAPTPWWQRVRQRWSAGPPHSFLEKL